MDVNKEGVEKKLAGDTGDKDGAKDCKKDCEKDYDVGSRSIMSTGRS